MRSSCFATASGWTAGPFERGDDPIVTMSVTRMVVGMALGRFFGDYPVALDQPVADVFPEWRQGCKRQIKVAMLLNPTSGIQNDLNSGVQLEPALHQIPTGLSVAEQADTWAEIEQSLRQFEGANGFGGPGEVFVGVGTA